jgi:hypothetical protein
LQRTVKQLGEVCLYEILTTVFGRDMQEILLKSKKDGSCKVYTANLASVVTGGTSLECLKLLSGYEGQPTSHHDMLSLGERFRKSLCETLRSGDRVLILIKDWHRVEPQVFLSWFMTEFWQPLISDIQRLVFPEYGRIKVIAVLASGSQVPLECLSGVPFCSIESFTPQHILDVPLPDWTVDDIEKWYMDVQKLGRTESRRLANQLHADSDGTPQTICSVLKERHSA